METNHGIRLAGFHVEGSPPKFDWSIAQAVRAHSTAVFVVRYGTSPATAAALLRRMAELVEQNPLLLEAEYLPLNGGAFRPDGEAFVTSSNSTPLRDWEPGNDDTTTRNDEQPAHEFPRLSE